MKQFTRINPTGGRNSDTNRNESTAPQASDRSNETLQPQREQKPERQKQPQQQQQGMPTADELKGKWKQQVGAAKIMWGKLTEDELLKLEGHQQKLAGLVQERYAITREEADKQVKKFFEQNKY